MISSILIKTKKEGINIIDNYVRDSKGFTLIELLVVIAIIGTLSTIGFIALTSSQQGASDAVKVSELQTLRGALTINYLTADGLPNTKAAAGTCEKLDEALSDSLTGKVEGIDWASADYFYCSQATQGTKGTVEETSTWAVIGVKGVTANKNTALKDDQDTNVGGNLTNSDCGDADYAKDDVFCLLIQK